MNFKFILIFVIFLYSCETKNINILDRDLISPNISFSNRGFALVFDNYELILKWNRSLRFALAVCTLKDKFKNEL